MFQRLLWSAYSVPQPSRLSPPGQPAGWPTAHGAMLSNKSWGRAGGSGRMFGVVAFILPSNCYVWWSPAFLEMAKLPMGSSEWILYFALLVRAMFALPVKLSLSQPTSFLIFPLLILFPIPLGSEQVSSWVVLSCRPALNPNSALKDSRSPPWEETTAVSKHKNASQAYTSKLTNTQETFG